MTAAFTLPDLGEGLPDAELVRWLVAEGDDVALNQPIAEVETAKAIVELPSPFAGTVRRLHAGAGDVVAVGSPLITIEATVAADGEADLPARVRAESAGAVEPSPGLPDTDAAPMTRAGAAPTGGPAVADEAVPNLVGYGAAPARGGPPHRRPRRWAPDTALAAGAAGAGGVPVIDAAPPDDRGSAADPTPDRGVRETRQPIRGIRRATAAAMVRSAFTAPHVTCFLDVDVTESMRLVASLRTDPRLRAHRIGFLAIVAKAVCLALRVEPALNARWDDDAGEIVQYHYVNLGIATATDRGLIVPHVPDAHTLVLPELADAIDALAQTTRAGRARPESLAGGTFSISNFGVLGVDAGTPILNPPEAGILGLGAVRRRPWEYEGAVELREVSTLSLSFDHRLVDGEQAARFLTTVGAVLRQPARAMLLV